jgi:hypothetical protein
MVINTQALAWANLAFEAALLLAVLTAAYLARKKKKFKIHCSIMRVAVPLQLIIIAVVMLPSMVGLIERGQSGWIFNTAMLVHHSLGLAVVILWVVINLLFVGIIKINMDLKILMRAAFFSWMMVLLLGAFLFKGIWL